MVAGEKYNFFFADDDDDDAREKRIKDTARIILIKKNLKKYFLI